MKCPVCSEACNDALCVCGYSFEDDKIVDLVRLQKRVESVARGPWPVYVRLVQAVTRIQSRKGISGRQTARDLGFSATQHHRSVTLADALDQHPQLAQCRNEDAARRKLKSLKNNPPSRNQNSSVVDSFESEEELQKYLAQHWDATSLGSDWKLYETGHVDTREIGIIDLLAQHRNRPSWLVVELKVRKTSDQVLGQVLRYMGWVKQHLAAENDTVEGLVIALGTDPQTSYGLKCLPDVRMMCYRLRGDALVLSTPDFERAITALSSLNDDERVKLIQQLKSPETAQ